jgi:hypothetical protein
MMLSADVQMYCSPVMVKLVCVCVMQDQWGDVVCIQHGS